MNNVLKLLVIVGIFLSLTGCAMVPEGIALNPVINTPVSNIGHGKKISVIVVDARPQKNLGERATYIGALGANIRLANDPAFAAKNAIFEGLRNDNFEPVEYSAENAADQSVLKLTIIDLKYKEIPHPFNLDIFIDSAIKVDVDNEGKSYSHTYRKQKVHTIAIAPPTSQDEIYINEVFSDNLRQILTDKKLLAVLSE